MYMSIEFSYMEHTIIVLCQGNSLLRVTKGTERPELALEALHIAYSWMRCESF